jgi:Ca2+-binding RTX toxin-like protein
VRSSVQSVIGRLSVAAVLTAAGVAAAVSPAAAASTATTVSTNGTTLVFAAGGSAVNNVIVTGSGGVVRVLDVHPYADIPAACFADTVTVSGTVRHRMNCSGFGRVEFQLGAGDDTLNAQPSIVPVTVYGQAGDDVLFGSAFGDELDGGFGDDQLIGGDGGDHLIGGPGKDLLIGDAGIDLFEAGLNADTINSADGSFEIVRCGDGVFESGDTVTADVNDDLHGCEHVTRV